MYSSDINEVNFSVTTLPKSVASVNEQINPLLGLIFKNLGFNSQTVTQQQEQNVDKILKNAYNDGSLEQVLNETCPDPQLRAKVLDILNPANENIETFCDDNDPGTAQWNKESGRIIINTSEKTSFHGLPRLPWHQQPPAGKLKILVHEAMHGAQNTVFDTQKEELLCEKTAIRTAIALANEKKLATDFKYPGTEVTYEQLVSMSEKELDNFLQTNFIARSYSNRIKDETGAVTINGADGTQIDIPTGSKIKIADGKEFEIGQTFIEGMGVHSGTVCNFFAMHDGRPINIGMVTFDDVKPQKQETMNPQMKQFTNPQEGSYQNAVIVIDGKEYNMKIFGYNEPFANFLSNSQ